MATDNLLLKNRSSDYKVQIQPLQQKTLTHLPQRPKVDLAFSNLNYTVKQGKVEKTILKSVSGRLRSGELTAIMGPSGAGKSTLLNILTGYRTEGVKGQILMNDSERDLSQFRKLSAYIMQDNQLHLNLTVDEAMNVAAKLKIGDKPKSERDAIVWPPTNCRRVLVNQFSFLDNRNFGHSWLVRPQKNHDQWFIRRSEETSFHCLRVGQQSPHHVFRRTNKWP
jgi:ABC-type dipeptide/oligopeptide/nickel transport system ATPase component